VIVNNIDEYQEKILTFMNPNVLKKDEDILNNAVYGLIGELGEFVDHLKKWAYHDQPLDLDYLRKESGDIAFYWNLANTGLGFKSSDILQGNVDKLTARYEGKAWTAEASAAKRDERK
jgi:NTP pyrophosphatase (non-canonical NTP hydrolase)